MPEPGKLKNIRGGQKKDRIKGGKEFPARRGKTKIVGSMKRTPRAFTALAHTKKTRMELGVV